jgi:hypothetical protein
VGREAYVMAVVVEELLKREERVGMVPRQEVPVV